MIVSSRNQRQLLAGMHHVGHELEAGAERAAGVEHA